MRPLLLGLARDGSAMRRLCLAACLVAEALVGPTAASLQAQNPAGGRDPSAADTNAIGMIGGTLTDAGDGQPMPYATVMLVGTERASFADAQGHFRFTRLPFNTYNLRARQIGYAPADTTIVLAGNGPTVDISLRMQWVPVRLPAVAVLGSHARGCGAPGAPDSAVDPALAGIFAQVRENADRFRMLLEAYPFRYRRLETVVLRSDPGEDSTLSVDTTEYESRARHPYRVGHVVYVDKDSHGHPVRLMYLPSFRDLADSTFLGTHCFQYAGTESLGPMHTTPGLRIDFRPADSIRAPDVAGSIYLDSASLIIRKAVFRLVNTRALHLSALGLTVTTTYRQIARLVPVIDSVTTEEPLTPVTEMVRGDAVGGVLLRPMSVRRTAIEQASLLWYEFERSIPGDVEPSGILRTPLATSASDTGRARRASTDTAPAALTLVGTVTDASGAAVPSAVAALIGTDDTTVTDDSGRFVLHGPRSGAYMLSVRRLGFAPQRLAISFSPEHPGRASVTLSRTVPVLPTVTTTAAERRGYRDVGFDDRMRAGLGYFLTYDQIVRKQATGFGELLKGIPGLVLQYSPDPSRPGWIVKSRSSGCVSYMVDGQPIAAVKPSIAVAKPNEPLGVGNPIGTVLIPDSPDKFIDADAAGAIEVYDSSERPTQFGRGSCALVVVWTRTRLGLPVSAMSADNTPANDAPVVRGAPTLDANAACPLPTAADTMNFPIYAILEGRPSGPVAEKVWTAYTDSVLSVLDRWSVLPTDLGLPTFGPPFTTDADAGGRNAKAGVGDVAPTLSSVFVFTLDSSGSLTGARVAASALPGPVDTSMLAELERADAAHAFPTFPGGPSGGGSVRFDLLVTSIEPAIGTKAAVLGRLQVPVWPLAREAQPLADSTGPAVPTQGADSVAVQMVVDAQGRVVGRTARPLGGFAGVGSDSLDTGYRGRAALALQQLRFEAARIGDCPVPQLVTQTVTIPRRGAGTQ